MPRKGTVFDLNNLCGGTDEALSALRALEGRSRGRNALRPVWMRPVETDVRAGIVQLPLVITDAGDGQHAQKVTSSLG